MIMMIVLLIKFLFFIHNIEVQYSKCINLVTCKKNKGFFYIYKKKGFMNQVLFYLWLRMDQPLKIISKSNHKNRNLE